MCIRDRFFGASLRIRELIDEDVRKFVASQLEDFIAAHELDQDVADNLVEIASRGLKRNPRRIKQFVNNLQLRLQMLVERKAQERIQIEPNVRVVAKLAIIEEEFPAEFEKLERDPSLLASWHERARAAESDRASEKTSDPVSDGAADRGKSEPPLELISFLRFTDDIQPRDIRAYLSLKQTRNEIRLPRHGEFVDLLDGGEIERLSKLLDDEAGEEAAYTDSARWHFDDQRKAKAWNRAHN